MSTPKARTIIALLVALLVVAVAYFAGIAVLAHNATKPEPTLTAYSHGKSVTVNPYLYCTVSIEGKQLRLNDCDKSQSVSDLDVPPGSPLQISLPSQVVDAPWEMLLLYSLDGKPAQRMATHRDYAAGARAITIPTPKDPRLKLATVEIHLPIPARDEQGNEGFISSGIWAIRTPAFQELAPSLG